MWVASTKNPIYALQIALSSQKITQHQIIQHIEEDLKSIYVNLCKCCRLIWTIETIVTDVFTNSI